LNKYSWNFKDDNSLEVNFYFELHWNLRLGGRGLKRQRARLMPPNKKIILVCPIGLLRKCEFLNIRKYLLNSN
jgi:hypothetical protein